VRWLATGLRAMGLLVFIVALAQQWIGHTVETWAYGMAAAAAALTLAWAIDGTATVRERAESDRVEARAGQGPVWRFVHDPAAEIEDSRVLATDPATVTLYNPCALYGHEERVGSTGRINVHTVYCSRAGCAWTAIRKGG